MTICQYWVMSWLDAITCVMLSKGVFPLRLSIFVCSKKVWYLNCRLGQKNVNSYYSTAQQTNPSMNLTSLLET